MALECSGYIGGWLPTNIIVLALAFIVVAVVYMLSRTMTGDIKGRLSLMIKSEITQLILSGVILGSIVLATSTSCSIVGPLTANVLLFPAAAATPASIPCPSTVITGANVPYTDPMSYAQSYEGYLAFVDGPSLASQIYGDAFQLYVQAAWWPFASSFLSQILLPGVSDVDFDAGPLSGTIQFPVGIDVTYPLQIVADTYLGVFLPITLAGISTSFLQYIILVIVQSAAFTLLLPIALIMRSIAFSGAGLRTSANSVIAFSIAMYIVFPLTIGFDHYAVNWMFTQCNGFSPTCNPNAAYVCSSTYQYQDFSGAMLAAAEAQPVSTIQVLGLLPIPIPNVASLIAALSSAVANLSGSSTTAIFDTLFLLNSTAEYFFITSLMFVVNLSITLGFAMGLSRSLNSGLEGAASFWSNI